MRASTERTTVAVMYMQNKQDCELRMDIPSARVTVMGFAGWGVRPARVAVAALRKQCDAPLLIIASSLVQAAVCKSSER